MLEGVKRALGLDNRPVLFVAKDEAGRALAEYLRSLISDLKIVEVPIEGPEDFPRYLAALEEIYGGIAVLQFRKYGVESLPCLVVGGEKVFEGYYPDAEELEAILAGARARAPAKLSEPERVEEGGLEVPEASTLSLEPSLGLEIRERVEAERVERVETAVETKKRRSRRTCYDCIMFVPKRSRCVALGREVDPENPPCAR